MPYGWYPQNAPSTMNAVGTMAAITNGANSNSSETVLHPLSGQGTATFDPGAGAFGI